MPTYRRGTLHSPLFMGNWDSFLDSEFWNRILDRLSMFSDIDTANTVLEFLHISSDFEYRMESEQFSRMESE